MMGTVFTPSPLFLFYLLTLDAHFCLYGFSLRQGAEEVLRVLYEDLVYLLVGHACVLERGEDVVEEVGDVPVGEQLLHALGEDQGSSQPEVDGVVGEQAAGDFLTAERLLAKTPLGNRGSIPFTREGQSRRESSTFGALAASLRSSVFFQRIRCEVY